MWVTEPPGFNFYFSIAKAVKITIGLLKTEESKHLNTIHRQDPDMIPSAGYVLITAYKKKSRSRRPPTNDSEMDELVDDLDISHGI